MPDSRKKLYDAISNEFDLGTFEEFNSKMNIPESRKKLYESVSIDFDLGTFDEFESKVGALKKKEQAMPFDGQKFGGKSEEPLLPLTSSTVSPSVSKPPKSTTPLESTGGKLPKEEVQIEKPISTQAIDNRDLALTVESRGERKDYLGKVSEGILSSIKQNPELYLSQKDKPTMYGEKVIPAGTPNVDNISKAVDLYAEKIKKETGRELSTFDKQNVLQNTLNSIKSESQTRNAAMLTNLQFQGKKKLPLTAITGVKTVGGEVVKESVFKEGLQKIEQEELSRLEKLAKTPDKQIDAEFKPEIDGLKSEVENAANLLKQESQDFFASQFEQTQQQIYNQYNELVQSGQMSADVANAEMKQKLDEYQVQLERDTNAIYEPKLNELKKGVEAKQKDIQTRYNRRVKARFDSEKEKASKRIQEEISKYENALPKGYMEEYQAAFKKNLDSEMNLEGLRKINEFSNLGNFEKMQTAIMAGMGDVASTIGGSLSYVGVNTGNLQNWVAQSGLYNELPVFSDDNIFDNLTNTDWWIANGVRSIPFTVATMPIGVAGGAGVGLLASALGAGKRAQVIASVVGGGFAGWEVERFLEQGAGFNDAINEGKSVSEAAEIAAAIGKYNYSTLPMNMLQMLPVFSKSFKFLGAAGIEAGAGAFEEINQGWAQAKAKAQSEGQDVSYLDYATSPQAIQEGAIGAAMSQGFTLFSLKNTPEVDKQINTLMTSIGMGGESQALEVLKTMKNNGAIDEKQFEEAKNLLNYTLNAISQTENINVDDNVKSALVNRFVAIEKAKELLTENENDLASQAAKELIAEKETEIKNILKGSEPVYLIRVVGNDVPVVSTKEEVESLLKSEKMLPLFQIEIYNDNSTKASVEEVYSKIIAKEEQLGQTDAGYSVIALDYLFTGGKGSMLSTDYLLQALVGGFTGASTEINKIRNKYANKLGNIKDDINSDVYNQMMNEIRGVINKKYNNPKAIQIFDKILNNATGFTFREGNLVSSELDKLNEQNESGISQEAAPKGDTGVEVTEPVIEEGKEQVEIEETPTKEEITPEQIETGRQEVSAVKEGKVETANPIRLFKGLFGKRNLDGTHKSAHPNAKGVFSAVDEKVAERYKGEDGMGTFDIPAGTTMEVIRLAVRNVPMSKFREQETEAINASDAQIVKLITTDAKGAEEQYVIKDPALIEKMQKPEEGAKAEEAVSESKSSEPSKSDKNYQEAQEANSIVSKENPNASVLIQPKGEDLSLTAIYVGKEKRGKGIGSKVLESVKKQANKLGKKVVLDATNELDEETDLERLGNFYEKNGFKKVGENKYEYDPKAKDSSGNIINGTDIEGTKESDITAGTNKGESSENVSVPTKEEVVQVETNKQQEDAVQKQTAGQVPVQPEAEVGEGVEGGKPEAEPKEATEESKEEAVEKQIDAIFNPDFKNTIVDKLSKFDKQIADKKFPSALEVAEHVLPRSIFNKYKKLYELAARNNITVSNERLPSGATAAWAFNNIQLNKNIAKYYLSDYNEFAETLNHEIIHGLISRGIRDNYALNNDLKDVMSQVLDRFDSASDEVKNIISYIQDTSKEFREKDYYGATDEELESDKLKEVGSLEELITYAFTNKEFADFLDSIPASKKINVKGKSIFQQLKNVIRDFISKKVRNATALDEINSVIDKYFDTSWNEEQIAERNEKYEWGLRFSANESIFDKYNNDPKLILEAYYKRNNPKLNKAVNELLGIKEQVVDGVKVENSKKAFEALLKEESASPTAKKKASELKKEAGDKAVKEAAEIMENIDSIRQQLLDAGVIKSINCKWG